MSTFDKLEELLVKKMENARTEEEQKGCRLISELLKNKEIFFQTPPSTVFGIFEFLGVKEEESIDMYTSLISPDSFKENVPKVRQVIVEDRKTSRK